MPLRVVAPCEIVAQDPVVMTAPLARVIEEVMVAPGAEVASGDVLFRYDARAPLQKLESARQDLEISRAQLRPATSLGLKDRTSRGEVAIADLEVERGQIGLAYAEAQAEQLEVRAPSSDVVIVEHPGGRRGRPVEIGERVLSLYDPNFTKLRMWIPEADNATFSQSDVTMDNERWNKQTLETVSSSV